MARINHKTARNDGLRPCKPPKPASSPKELTPDYILEIGQKIGKMQAMLDSHEELISLLDEAIFKVEKIIDEAQEKFKRLEELEKLTDENSETLNRNFDNLQEEINNKIMPYLHVHR